jgi:hypothetical protein
MSAVMPLVCSGCRTSGCVSSRTNRGIWVIDAKTRREAAAYTTAAGYSSRSDVWVVDNFDGSPDPRIPREALSSVARHDPKRLPAFDSVDREICAIRREHGRAIELFGQRDQRGVRKVHRQVGVLVQQFPNALQ